MRNKQIEHPDRPHVRAIYAAQAIGFPIHDPTEFEAYRAALTSLVVTDDPELETILRPLAARAQDWVDANDPKAARVTTVSEQRSALRRSRSAPQERTRSRIHPLERHTPH